MSALDEYKEFTKDCEDELDPLERLRFFYSLSAMDPEDWLDSEIFFDQVAAQIEELKNG